MPTLLAYERDPYLKTLETRIVEAGEVEGRPFAVLEDTVLYPEGGGQPSDRGTLGGVPVLDVRREGGVVRHFLASAVPAGTAGTAGSATTVVVDWARRWDHMQQHSGQHLLTAVAQDRFGWETTAFHLGPEVSDVELAVPRPARESLEALEEAVAAEIRAAREVTARRVDADEFARLAVRTRGLPDGHSGEIRLVEISGVDLNTCGGTHVASTSELESLKLLGTESLRGGTRLFFVAGGRVRRRLGEHEERAAVLRAVLGAPDAGLGAAASAKLEALRGAEKRLRALEGELASAAAGLLAARPGRFVDGHWEGRDAAFLQRLARELQELAPAKAALLTASGDSGAFFVLAAGAGAPVDVAAAGRRVADLLGGKGGGSGRTFQGKAPSLERRAEAREVLEALASGLPDGPRGE